MTDTITRQAELDQAHAEAIRFLVDQGEFEVAVALGRARLTRIERSDRGMQVVVYLTADPGDRDRLSDEVGWEPTDEGGHTGPGALTAAFEAVTTLATANMWPEVVLGAPAEEVGRHQGTARQPGTHEYNGTRYRSATEIRVAKALDEANVLYFPLPLGIRHYRRLAEPDFLVIHLGRTGILEIDGPTHTPLTRAQESAKDALLKQSGIRDVHHVAVADVDRDPAAVVQHFLRLLRGPIY